MQVTGIQIDGSVIRWITLKKHGRDLRIIHQHTQQNGNNVKLLYSGFERAPLVSGLPATSLIVHSISLPAPSSFKLREALVLQIESQLHFKTDELLIRVVQNSKEKYATAYSTTKNAFLNHLAELQQIQLDPERIGTIPAALMAFVRWKAPTINSYFLIDIGQRISHCLWVEKGVIRKAHGINFGLDQLKIAYQQDRKKLISLKDRNEIDFSVLKSEQYPNLLNETKNFRRELTKFLHSFQCQRPLIFTGESDVNRPLKEFFQESFRDYISEEIKINLEPEELPYASCCGLAIDYLINRKQPLQFRSSTTLASRSWNKLGRYIVGLFSAALFLCVGLYKTASWWIDKREAEIIRNLETWTTTQDPEFRFELFSVGNKIEDLVGKWLQLIEKNSKGYPFLMKAPRVAIFLDWLLHHPLIQSFRSSGDPISFQEIRYRLDSFPKLGALGDPYEAKIELEVVISNPLHARKFHEEIVKEGAPIDTSREITWEALSGRYRTSFYLKNDSYGIF